MKQIYNFSKRNFMCNRAITIFPLAWNHLQSFKFTMMFVTLQGIYHFRHKVINVKKFKLHARIIDLNR